MKTTISFLTQEETKRLFAAILCGGFFYSHANGGEGTVPAIHSKLRVDFIGFFGQFQGDVLGCFPPFENYNPTF
jgi:hypothetical protein